jgi:O-antigen/teichoic acid export membrane protein
MLQLALKNWVAKMLASLLNFGTVILLSRNLGAENRGICFFYTVVIAFCLVFNELAAGSTVVYLQQTIRWRQIRKVAALWSLMASGVVCVALWLAGRFRWDVMVLLWLISAANGVVTLQYNVLLSNRKYVIYNILSVVTPTVILISMLVLVFIKMSSPFHYLLSIGAAVGVALVGSYWALRNSHDAHLPLHNWSTIIKKSFGTGALNQAGHVVSIFNNRYVFYLFPAAALGVFSNALSLAEAMLLVPGSMGQIFYSQVVSAGPHHASSTAYRKIFIRFWGLSSLLMALGLVFVWLVPGGFYTWLFGPQFGGVKPFLLVLAWGMFGYNSYLLISYWQSAAGKFERNLFAGLAGLLVNMVGLVWLYWAGRLVLQNVVVVMCLAYLAMALAAIFQYRTLPWVRQ